MEEGERLRVEEVKIKFIDPRCKGKKLIGFRKAKRKQNDCMFLGLKDDLWGEICEVGSESWNGREMSFWYAPLEVPAPRRKQTPLSERRLHMFLKDISKLNQIKSMEMVFID